eukprot:1263083-Prymnesium_polylepis.2
MVLACSRCVCARALGSSDATAPGPVNYLTTETMLRAGLKHHIPTTRSPDHPTTTSPPHHPQHPHRTPTTRHGPTRWDLCLGN